MAIFLDETSRILVNGMTGSEGTKHTRRMVASGAQVVAGVTPGKGGQEVDGIPVFDSVKEAADATGANVSVIFVPPRFTAASVDEVIDAGRPAVRRHHGGRTRPRHRGVLRALGGQRARG